ncbi:multicopper oxidase domain-containing protein [Hymenobacter frigidus]|uniref:multicopper oxidase domain-containing protein n=1 Tax=Hymenobacter frigidus TaxID=1524095 RepID=UPI00166966FE|nr:multicopper oxidase domain-containing protein [Hymenobacter frigidus]
MKLSTVLFPLLVLLPAFLPAVAQTMPGMQMPASAAPQPPRTVPAPKAAPAGATTGARPAQVGKRVEYDLYVMDSLVNFTGKIRSAVVINGRLPGPTLRFTEGDTAVVRVHNRLKGATSMHWHGLILPNAQDGVPYLNTAPILPGTTHTFTFPLVQHGTYWYHAHGLEEQLGMYGSFVIQPKESKPAMREYVLLLSDWTDERPAEVLRYLKRAGEWYAVKKGATQSYGEALAAGYFKDKVKQEWGRMPAMDVSDVFYNKFLVNGQEQAYFKDAQPGEVVRLRVINGGTSSYFHLQYAGGPLQVVAADGNDVVPFPVTKLEIATAETYDLLITVPPIGAAELRATSSDVTGYTSAYFGSGEAMKAPDLPKLDYFQLTREMNQMGPMTGLSADGAGQMSTAKKGQAAPNAGDMKGMKMQNSPEPAAPVPTPRDRPMNRQERNGLSMGSLQDQGIGMDMGGMAGEFNYNRLRAPRPTTLDSTHKWREIKLTLTGNMLRYIWSFDNKTLSVADAIPIRKGENVRMVLQNLTMMRHPLHLHGHVFRLVNAQGAYSPMKNTFDIPSMSVVTIEFAANAEQDWFFHCHTLYHMAAGMGRVISYEGSPQNEFAKTGYKVVKAGDNARYPWLDFSVHSQATFLEANVSNNKNALEFEGRFNYRGDYETETHLLRYLDKRQFLAAYVGFDSRNNKTLRTESETNTKNNRRVVDAGVYYLLPLLVRSEWRVDNTGKLRLQLERRDLPLSNNVFADLRVNTDKEYTVGFRYMVRKCLSLSTNYDSDYKWGAGLTFHY